MPLDVAALRESYTRAGLTEAEAGDDPLALFERWLGEAVAAGLPEPNAMTLATTGPDGQPSARVVLLKGFDAEGFVFYTSYDSRKGRQLAERPRAALVFWWAALERQVRVEGAAERVPAAASDAYFARRPRGSRLGAWASDQSRPLPNRAALERRLAEAEARFAEGEVPRPEHWGGFRVRPARIEFWQGRPNRLHDRLEYVAGAGGWRVGRLAP